jgi:predicted dinucleotide-binding enzyme
LPETALVFRMPEQRRIGIIGDGNVGTALTQGLTRAGYEAQPVGREPGRVREVAAWGDVIVLAVPFPERENAVREMGGAYAGKVLIDVTNALDDKLGYVLNDKRESGAEQLQKMAQGAKVVKAFNTVFAQNMSTGQLYGERLTAFAASDDEPARQRVVKIAQDIGFDGVDAGPLENARWLETLGVLNVRLGYQMNMGPGIGFKLVHPGNVADAPAREARAQRT